MCGLQGGRGEEVHGGSESAEDPLPLPSTQHLTPLPFPSGVRDQNQEMGSHLNPKHV